ncbi:MAG: SurA N-terminal domain-containing protein [Microgenomates group bacterium]
MSKAAKKLTSPKGGTSKKAVKTTKQITPILPVEMPAMVTTPKMNSKVITFALVVILLGLLTYKLGPKLVPAMVANTPVTRFELWSRLEKSYGAQALDDMINEKILDKAIADAHIKVDATKLSDQVKTLEKQFETTGGLDEALKQRGLSRKDLEKQISTQLAVEELLADKINPTEDEVKKQFDAGAVTTYKDKKFDEVSASITDELKQSKLRDEFLAWFGEIKKTVKVKNFGL